MYHEVNENRERYPEVTTNIERSARGSLKKEEATRI